MGESGRDGMIERDAAKRADGAQYATKTIHKPKENAFIGNA